VDRRTFLYERHVSAGARMVPFAGWSMPLHYGSQIDEHHAVRAGAGVFDVSHMQIVDLDGADTVAFLRLLLANDVAKLRAEGRALYTCMLNERGGVIDDLIVYRMPGGRYRLVVNAATAEKDLAWIDDHAGAFGVAVVPRRDLAMLAVQGPTAREVVGPLLPAGLAAGLPPLAPFAAALDGDWLVARTGYTGEDGIELMLPGEAAPAVWDALLAAGVRPCGLGARDTLRLEAGLPLYGQDMDESVTPLESGLGWTVAFDPTDRAFVGRAALEAQRGRPDLPRFVGLVLSDRGVLRAHQKVFAGGEEIGEITSGGYAPTLDRSVALARLRGEPAGDCAVEIRGRRLAVTVVRPPFVRHGQVLVSV
jgi:aminomethyltransferase